MNPQFTKYINDAYKKWRDKQGVGREGSVKRFSAWLGIPNSTVATWIDGGYPPSKSNPTTIGKLADKLGGEIYEILDVKDPFAVEMMNKIKKLSPKGKEWIAKEIERISNAEIRKRGL